MALFSRWKTIDHSLPTSRVAKWPVTCVECGAGDSDSEYKCVGVWFLGALPLRWNVVKIPACAACVRRLRRDRWSRRIEYWILAALVGGGTFLLTLTLGLELPPWMLKLLAVVVGIVAFCFMPGRPARIDIVLGPLSTTYQFRDPELARRFMELNSPVAMQESTG